MTPHTDKDLRDLRDRGIAQLMPPDGKKKQILERLTRAQEDQRFQRSPARLNRLIPVAMLTLSATAGATIAIERAVEIYSQRGSDSPESAAVQGKRRRSRHRRMRANAKHQEDGAPNRPHGAQAEQTEIPVQVANGQSLPTAGVAGDSAASHARRGRQIRPARLAGRRRTTHAEKQPVGERDRREEIQPRPEARKASSARATVPPASVLARQTAWFRRGLSLRGVDDDAALRNWRTFKARWPHSPLSHEVELQLLKTLIRLRRASEARAVARRFVRQYPDSLRVEEVRAIAAGDTAPPKGKSR